VSDVETDTLLMVVRREEGGAAAANKATVDWALSRLERGQDTPGLLILASLSSPFSSWEVDQYLKQALQELGESLPNRDVALWWRARSLAR
jgi:hypothetical protein